MIDKKQLDNFVQETKQHNNAVLSQAVFSRYMCRCLLRIRELLPEVGNEALDVACAYWLDGSERSEDLEKERVKCWAYLDTTGGSTDIKTQEDVAMRALICALYSDPENDDFPGDTLDWFVDMFDKLGKYSDETESLMKLSEQ